MNLIRQKIKETPFFELFPGKSGQKGDLRCGKKLIITLNFG